MLKPDDVYFQERSDGNEFITLADSLLTSVLRQFFMRKGTMTLNAMHDPVHYMWHSMMSLHVQSGRFSQMRLWTNRMVPHWEFDRGDGTFEYSLELSVAIECTKTLSSSSPSFVFHRASGGSCVVIPNDGLQIDMSTNMVRSIRCVAQADQNIDLFFQGSLLDSFIDVVQPPPDIICPISQHIMRNPVKLSDGHVYDYEEIIHWFQHKATSPLTGLTIDPTHLEPALEVRKLVLEYRAAVVNHIANDDRTIISDHCQTGEDKESNGDEEDDD